MPPRIEPSMLESAVEQRISPDLSELSSIRTADLDEVPDEEVVDEVSFEESDEDTDSVGQGLESSLLEEYQTIEDKLENLDGYLESAVELLPQHLESVPNLEGYRENEIENNLGLLRESMQNYETYSDDTELRRVVGELSGKYQQPTMKLMQMINTIRDLQLVQNCITSFNAQRVPFWQRRLQRRPSEQEVNRAQRKLDYYYDLFDETDVLTNSVQNNSWDELDDIQSRIAYWIDNELDKEIRECVVNGGRIRSRGRTTRRTGRGSKQRKRQTFKARRKTYAGMTRGEFVKLAMQCRVSRKKAQDIWSSFVALGETMIPHQKNYIELLRRNMRSSKCAPHPKKTRRLRNIKKISGITKKKFMDAAMRCHNSKRHAEEIWRAFVILGTNIAPHKRGYTRKIKHLGKKTRCANKKHRKNKTRRRN